MNFIKSGFLLFSNILGMSCRLYVVLKGYVVSKFVGNILLIKSLFIELFIYRCVDLLKEYFIIQNILLIFDISENFVVIRVQGDKFIDLKNKIIQGYKNIVVKVRDWYNLY